MSKVIISALLLLAYLMNFGGAEKEIFFFSTILILVGVLTFFEPIKSMGSEFLENIKSGVREKIGRRDRTFILIFLILAIVSVKHVGWVAENIAPSVIVFSSLITVAWLYKIKYSVFSKLAILLILFVAFLSQYFRPTAEVFAEITYLLIGSSVIIKLKEDI